MKDAFDAGMKAAKDAALKLVNDKILPALIKEASWTPKQYQDWTMRIPKDFTGSQVRAHGYAQASAHDLRRLDISSNTALSVYLQSHYKICCHIVWLDTSLDMPSGTRVRTNPRAHAA